MHAIHSIFYSIYVFDLGTHLCEFLYIYRSLKIRKFTNTKFRPYVFYKSASLLCFNFYRRIKFFYLSLCLVMNLHVIWHKTELPAWNFKVGFQSRLLIATGLRSFLTKSVQPFLLNTCFAGFQICDAISRREKRVEF